ncbi:hypothetical protein K431DRAFT_272622 [Polychaeton citri CBS 116435]|uniref:Uncharacterized protein n=1 Tax=Polychaeton citri CBS 116435 TaxID=1314669 RepID=A0A9P4Q2U4_9PEZI|nr:hypothetical protein K431DRAFT_272622 [Polychaeton citri CBS 116435]
MHFATFIIPFVVASSVLASPISSFRDIERRWFEGQSEKQIHNAHDIREATPAWNVDRNGKRADSFSFATDSRTMQENLLDKRDDKLTTKMKEFVKDFMASKGMDITDEIDQDAAPVLKPKRGMEYRYTS